MPTTSKNLVDLMSEIMDKMVDTQAQSAQALAQLRSNYDLCAEMLKEIRAFFNNGFRSEIHECKREIDECRKNLEDLKTERRKDAENLETVSKKLDQLAKYIKSPWTWIKLIFLAIIGLATCVVAMHELIDMIVKK